MGGKGSIAAAVLAALALFAACADGGMPAEERPGPLPEEEILDLPEEEILDLPEEEQIRILLEKNLEANEEGDSRAIFRQYAPSQLRGCSYDDVKDILGEGGPANGGSEISYRDLLVTVNGDVAAATLVLQIDGLEVPVTADQPLRFVREEGRWYFEAPLDMRERCQP